MRDPRPNVFSIERVYKSVRSALSSDHHSVEWVCRNSSSGFLPRLRDAWAARKAQGDVNHVTGDTHYLTYFLDRRRTVLTIHDLVSIERSSGMKRLALWFLWFWLPVWRSHLVVTVSEATRQALLKAVRCSPDKVLVIHNPISEEFKRVARVFNAECPRILQIGTKLNKNILRVAEALSGLQCKLIIVGQLTPEIVDALQKNKIDYENYVGLDREALVDQYAKADILMFASTYEGFGLPIIEANAVGRPVLTSNLPPMTEVAEEAACLVNPYDTGSIRAGVLRIVNDSAYRENLVAAGYQNALRFRAKNVAEKYARVYRQVAFRK